MPDKKEDINFDKPHDDSDLPKELQEQLKIDEEMSKESEWSEYEKDYGAAVQRSDEESGWPEE